MSGCVRLLGEVVEVVDDAGGPDDDGAVLEHQHRHAADAGVELEHIPSLGILRHLSGDEVEPQLGQALPDALRPATPLGLEELEHPVSIVAGAR